MFHNPNAIYLASEELFHQLRLHQFEKGQIVSSILLNSFCILQ
jgi:hypothetical protein